MKTLKKVILAVILVSISIGLLFVGNGYDMYKSAIEEVPIKTKVDEIKSRENYTYLSELPEIYLNAIISVEDHRFYKHNGIDVIAIGRAVVNDIKSFAFVEGGSTITQQIAKNEYFTQEKKMTRKIAEVFMAFEIEKNAPTKAPNLAKQRQKQVIKKMIQYKYLTEEQADKIVK